MESRGLRAALRIWVVVVLAFLFIPIVLIVVYAFNKSNIESWPISSFTLHWFSVAWHDSQVRTAFLLSIKVALISTAIAMLLGSAVAYAVNQFKFFGREGISFLLVLPLALPGIITGIALNSFFSFNGTTLGTLTIVVWHALRGIDGSRRTRLADAMACDPATDGHGPGLRCPAGVCPVV